MGATVTGLSLAPETSPNLHTLARIDKSIAGGLCYLNDRQGVATEIEISDPQIVIHMAAQPLVRQSVRDPVATFATNVMGTVGLLDALRQRSALQGVLIVTTDKVYENNEHGRAFGEGDPLGGHDPYSASKAATEIAVQSFRRTYFEVAGIPLATARGGNVIGGGDFSQDRIVPDIWRAMKAGRPIKLRYPQATRPWQHVLDCVAGYLCYVQALVTGKVDAPTLNFGPEASDPVTVADLVVAMQKALGATQGWVQEEGFKPHEMLTLALDCKAARDGLGWRNKLSGHRAIEATANWYLALERCEDMRDVTLAAIEEYSRT